MSFRPFDANIWRAALAGWVCLVFAGAARAGEDARSIEVVPFRNTSINTNLEQPEQDDSQAIKTWDSVAPDTVKSVNPTPRLSNRMPRPQQSLNKKEQQLQDRRRNWVFATPEDESMDKAEKSLLGLDNDDDNMTAMERYYYRLEQSGRTVVTNGASGLVGNRFGAQTNSYVGVLRPTEPGSFGATPFREATPDASVFQQPGAGDISANTFGNDSSRPVLTPEEVRVQTEQKSRMDSFKQLWNIDQAPATTPVMAPASGPIDSAPLFGASSPGLQAPVKRLPGGPTSASAGSTAPPEPEPYTAPRASAPPHADFTPPQRPF